MKSFFEILRLELTAVVRSRTLAVLSVVSLAWMFILPYVAKGDGTADGARELYVHYSLGGVFALLVVALVSSATGSISRERTARRLQLTMVRPVRYFVIAFGRIAAYVVTGAFVLALSLAVLLLRVDATRSCSHLLTPVLPSVQEEAREMYDGYMRDPKTPDEVKKASKSVVLRLLAQKALDHYQPIPTNATTEWKFDLSAHAGREATMSVRLRLTNQFDLRQDVTGTLALNGLCGVVSNITQAVLTVPLGTANVEPEGRLTFDNRGKHVMMLRPRRDLNLLVSADSFAANAFRAYLEMVGALAAVVAFGVFLGAGLGRPVALFVAMAVLIVGEMSPSVVDQYPDQLETDPLDRIGLALSRFAAEVTHPISSLAPAEALSKDECVEVSEVVRILFIDLLAVPLLLALLSAVVMPLKQEDL